MIVLFVIAHPDDEAFGPFGTMLKLKEEGNEVRVICLCNGARPGSEHVSSQRVDSFKRNCTKHGLHWEMFDNNDLTLNQQDTTNIITQLVETYEPDEVYTHNISDLNNDHRILAEGCLVACRPKPNTSVNKLFFFEVPSSTDWAFHKIGPSFAPNYYVELTQEQIEQKQIALEQYQSEIYSAPDARSIEANINLLKYRGNQVGVMFAEAFQLVYARDRKTQ